MATIRVNDSVQIENNYPDTDAIYVEAGPGCTVSVTRDEHGTISVVVGADGEQVELELGSSTVKFSNGSRELEADEHVDLEEETWDPGPLPEKPEGCTEVWLLETSMPENLWGDEVGNLTSVMEEMQTRLTGGGTWWTGTVKNFGWMHQSGAKRFQAKDGSELLHGTLPDTDCHFAVYFYPDRIEINNAHHDAPMGGEWYVLRPGNDDTVEETT